MKYLFIAGLISVTLVVLSNESNYDSVEYEVYDSEKFYRSIDSLSSLICIENFGKERSMQLIFEINFLIFFTDSNFMFAEFVQIVDSGGMTKNEIDVFSKEFKVRAMSIRMLESKVAKHREVQMAKRHGGSTFILATQPLCKKEMKRMFW